jgi:hypothetical protein
MQDLVKGLNPDDIMQVEDLFKSTKKELQEQMRREDFDPDDFMASLESGDEYLDEENNIGTSHKEEVLVRRVDGTRWTSVGDLTEDVEELLTSSPFNKEPPSPQEKEKSLNERKDQKSRETLINILDDGSKDIDPIVLEALARTGRNDESASILDDDGLLSMDRIDKEWAIIEFGRAPKPDYKSKTIDERYVHNVRLYAQYKFNSNY